MGMQTSRVPEAGGESGTPGARGGRIYYSRAGGRGVGKSTSVPQHGIFLPSCRPGVGIRPGKVENVTEAHRENQEGHCERSEHGPTGFRGGPQCSREKVVSNGAHFRCFQVVLWHFWHFRQFSAVHRGILVILVV